MDRRLFVRLLAASPLAKTVLANDGDGVPKYRIVTPHKSSGGLGMPGPYPGKVVSVKSANCLDESGDNFNVEVIREMMSRGMCELTKQKKTIDAWKRFFVSSDVVGIKVNAGAQINTTHTSTPKGK